MAKLPSDIRKYYIFRALLKRFIVPIIVVYGIDRGLTLEQMALIAGAGSVAGFLLEVPSGAVADYIGHRRALVFSMLGQAASMAMYLGGTFPWIMAGTVLYFAAGSFMTGTAEALFFERVRALGLENEHAKLYGQGKGFATAVSVASMALAGVLYEVAWHLPFLIGIAQFLAAAVLISTFGPTRQTVSVQKKEGAMAFFAHFGEAARAIYRTPQAFWLIITSALVIGPLFGLGDFQQAIMNDVGMATAIIGLVYAGKRLLSIWVQGYIHLVTDSLGAPKITLVSAALAILHLVLVGIIRDPLLLLAPLMMGSIAWVGLEVATNHYLNKLLDTNSRATALSMANLVRNSIQLLTLVAFGILASKSAQFAYGMIGIIIMALIAFPLLQLFKVNQKPA